MSVTSLKIFLKEKISWRILIFMVKKNVSFFLPKVPGLFPKVPFSFRKKNLPKVPGLFPKVPFSFRKKNLPKVPGLENNGKDRSVLFLFRPCIRVCFGFFLFFFFFSQNCVPQIIIGLGG